MTDTPSQAPAAPSKAEAWAAKTGLPPELVLDVDG
jgi:hypothetical protein